MTLFNINIVTRRFYVAEIVGNRKIRVTQDFDWLADAEAAKSRMRGGKFVVVDT